MALIPSIFLTINTFGAILCWLLIYLVYYKVKESNINNFWLIWYFISLYSNFT